MVMTPTVLSILIYEIRGMNLEIYFSHLTFYDSVFYFYLYKQT